MALHTLKIVVVDGGRASNYSTGSSSATTKTTHKVDKESPLYKLLNAKEIIKEKMEKKITASGVYAVSTFGRLAIQTAKSFHNYRVSDIGRKHGDSNYQAMVNREYEVAGEIAGIVGGAVNGAMAGVMTGNPIGVVVGLVAGVASSAINLGFKYAEKERSYQHEMFKNNTSQAYNLARANYSISTGRLR